MENSDVFVQPQVTASYNGFVDAHNVLAQKLVDAQKAIEALQQGHEQAVAAAKEQVAKDDERWAAEALKLEELEKKLTEQIETVKAQAEERCGAIEQKVEGTLKTHEESLDVKFQAMQHSLDEFGIRQGEFVSRVLPKWEKEMGDQVKKVAADLAALGERQVAFETKIAESNDANQAEMREAQKSMEERFGKGIQGNSQRLSDAEGMLEKLSAEIANFGSCSSKRDEELSSQLKDSCERIEAFAKSEAKIVLTQLSEDFGPKLINLEGVVKQMDFERLSSKRKVEEDLATLKEDLSRNQKACTESQQRESAKLMESLANFASTHRRNFDQACERQDARHEKLERHVGDLTTGLEACADRFNASINGVEQRITTEVQRLESALVDGIESCKEDVCLKQEQASKETAQRFADAEQKRCELADRLKLEEENRQFDVADTRERSHKAIAALELGMASRFESCRGAVDELASEFQGYVRAQQSRELDASRLENLVRALEVRVWPWRSHAKDRGDRSPSPTPPASPPQPKPGGSAGASGNIDAEATMKEWQNHWGRSPKKPASSRPGSATYRRAPPQEKDVSSLFTFGSPVGAGSAAARARQTPRGDGPSSTQPTTPSSEYRNE
eukprot:TRINITY_DN39726_c0_g1_i1.p1 TRINITY_DN39726_c0_g1~~TRINITY_DN39726_c0_g1_i1.p1  ORF type:complete len:618 (-),score=145.29 TRINITY_DN39726_c0_g1_i1:137-1990(-)